MKPNTVYANLKIKNMRYSYLFTIHTYVPQYMIIYISHNLDFIYTNTL